MGRSLAIVSVGFSAGVKKVLTSSAHRSRVIPETAGGYDVVETAGAAAGLSWAGSVDWPALHDRPQRAVSRPGPPSQDTRDLNRPFFVPPLRLTGSITAPHIQLRFIRTRANESRACPIEPDRRLRSKWSETTSECPSPLRERTAPWASDTASQTSCCLEPPRSQSILPHALAGTSLWSASLNPHRADLLLRQSHPRHLSKWVLCRGGRAASCPTS